jgi:hypothetical protein
MGNGAALRRQRSRPSSTLQKWISAEAHWSHLSGIATEFHGAPDRQEITAE